MVANVVAEDPAVEKCDVAGRRLRCRDPAAFAAVRGGAAVFGEGLAAVGRDRVVDRRPCIRLPRLGRRQPITLVDPGEIDVAARVDDQRLETMPGHEPVVVDRAYRLEAGPAVERPGETYLAVETTGQLSRPRYVHLAAGTNRNLRTVLTVDVDLFGVLVDGDRRAQGLEIALARGHVNAAAELEGNPQLAPVIENRGGCPAAVNGRCARPRIAVRARGCRSAQCKRQCQRGNDPPHHRSTAASRYTVLPGHGWCTNVTSFVRLSTPTLRRTPLSSR